MKKILFTIAAGLFFANCFAQANCEKLKHTKLKCLSDTGKNTTIFIEGERFTETTADGKYHIDAKLKWVDNCMYETTITNTNVPNFAFKPGDGMKVRINKIEGPKVYLSAIVNDQVTDLEYEITE